MRSRGFHALCVAGTHSGVGKTTLTLGLLAALRRRGLCVQPFKCGPDYIDPGHHTLAAGRPSRNLDTWIMGADAVQRAYARACMKADAAVVEGVMGLFDGASSSDDEGSTAHVCRLLAVPVILVVQAKAMARSIAALVHGFAAFAPEVRVAGVIANQVGSEGHASILRESLDAAGLPPLLGAVPACADWTLAERHLGLVTAAEGGDRAEWFARLADGIEQHVDIDRLLACCAANAAPDATFAKEPEVEPAPHAPSLRLGVARDEAFQFYYEDNLDMLRARGVELVPFSPLQDRALPAGLAGLYLGGGYPELHAAQLADNRGMRASILDFAESGKPVYAECGGFMYLCASLADVDGREWEMCGVFPVRTRMETRLRRLGYVEAETLADGLFGERGTRIRGHEFHWSHVESGSADAAVFRAHPARSDEAGAETGLRRGRVWASYLHLHFASNPSALEAWVRVLRGGSKQECV